MDNHSCHKAAVDHLLKDQKTFHVSGSVLKRNILITGKPLFYLILIIFLPFYIFGEVSGFPMAVKTTFFSSERIAGWAFAELPFWPHSLATTSKKRLYTPTVVPYILNGCFNFELCEITKLKNIVEMSNYKTCLSYHKKVYNKRFFVFFVIIT